MKIALLTSIAEIGGGESNLINLATKLSNNSDVTVFCPSGTLFDLLTELNIKVISTDELKRRGWVKFFPLFFLNSDLRLSLKKFDIVHAYTVNCLPFLFLCEAHIVCTLHGYWDRAFGLRGMIIDLFTDKVICVSNDVYNTSELPPSKKVVIHLGLQLQNRKIVNSSKNHIFDKNLVRILVVARLQKIKGHDILLDALHEISKKKKNRFILNMVGDINYLNKENIKYKNIINTKIESYRNDFLEINFVGFKKDVFEYIRKCDFVVIPSRYESFSMVAIESLSVGVPIIAPNIGGPREIVNKKSIGILFDPGNIKDLATSIEYMVNNYDDYISEDCINRAKFFSVDIQADKHLNLYKQILNDR
jgi:glycosyltransferase involved in cell wall biosynthesis